MDAQQRGRSPSSGQQGDIRHSRSPSSHSPFQSNVSNIGVDPSLVSDPGTFNPNNSYDLNHPYMGSNQQSSPHFSQESPYASNLLDPTAASASPGNNQFDNQFYQGGSPGSTTQDQYINPSNLLDPQLLDTSPHSEGSVDPSNLMNSMATAQHTPTPPHMLQPGVRSSASPHHSPSISQSSFHSGSHSRHTSLDPSSAAYPTGAEWAHIGNPAFQGHRRAPSDAYSEVSSNHPSPYLSHADQFESDQPSPLLAAQTDPAMFQDVMTFQQFTISENQNTTPGHSPHISPRLPPQQQQELPPFTAADNFGLHQPMGSPYGGMHFPEQPSHGPSHHGHSASVDFGQADQMSPPEINIDFAPPSRQPSFGPRRNGASDNALSPPGRSKFPWRFYVQQRLTLDRSQSKSHARFFGSLRRW